MNKMVLVSIMFTIFFTVISQASQEKNKKGSKPGQMNSSWDRPNSLKEGALPRRKYAAVPGDEAVLDKKMKSFLNKTVKTPKKRKLVVRSASQTKRKKFKGFEKQSENDKIGKKSTLLDGPKESEVPLFLTHSKPIKSYPWWRMLTSFAVVVAIGALLLLFAKWWKKKKNYELGNNKIKILTQYYLSPKKSLAIVRVAGEAILIGITEQNISKLKTLSFLDDELPEEVPEDFGKTLSHVTSLERSSGEVTESRLTKKEIDESSTNKPKVSESSDFRFGQDSTKRVIKKLRNMRSI